MTRGATTVANVGFRITTPTIHVFPAPVLSTDGILSYFGSSLGYLWDAPGKRIGASSDGIRIVGHGESRFSQVIEHSSELWADLIVTRQPDAKIDLGPVVVGGAAFLPGWASELSALLGDALFILPTCGYVTDGRDAVGWRAMDRSSNFPQDLPTWDNPEVRRAFSSNPQWPIISFAPQVASSEATVDTLSAWTDNVNVILDAITANTVEKVVLARHTTMRLKPSTTAQDLVLAMGDPAVGQTRFLFQPRSGLSVVGKSPERLVRVDGLRVDAEAVAGTRHAEIQPAELLCSAKDRKEHRFVVDGILSSLRPLCEHTRHQSEPNVRLSDSVQHLVTPITGHMVKKRHVLDLVAAVHPSPALCGTPRSVAQDWIRRLEKIPRGWYGGPIGWFDQHGNGDFSVNIRSAFLTGDQAHVYAGAGIVADSQPVAEFEETEAKWMMMRRVLRARER